MPCYNCYCKILVLNQSAKNGTGSLQTGCDLSEKSARQNIQSGNQTPFSNYFNFSKQETKQKRKGEASQKDVDKSRGTMPLISRR